jgi:hypothetical protein
VRDKIDPLQLLRAFSAQTDLLVVDPGAMPLAIKFHAFSVKNYPTLDFAIHFT